MPLASGCQHVALITANLGRFIAFYASVFEAETVFELEEDGLRHAMIHLGGGFWLHPFQFPGDHPEAAGKPGAFARGHVDHFAVDVGDRPTFEIIRSRLVEEGASDGTVTDFGMLDLVTFVDPDGMEVEVAIRKHGAPLRFSERTQTRYEPSLTT
jgi:catechol 2,3-dioxygenase-like lactoylglutathione lyase family enzyme